MNTYTPPTNALTPPTTNLTAPLLTTEKSPTDYETFLKMLTVQIKNQDPMNPMESNEFAVQLATFSGVEQQVITNELLESLASQSTSANLVQMSNIVGRTVRTSAPTPYYGDKVEVLTTPSTGSDEAYLAIIDHTGNEIERLKIDPKGGLLEWPSTSSGKTAAFGRYSFKVLSFHKGMPLGTSTAETFAKVTGVELYNGLEVLTFQGGGTANLSEIKAIF